ncbi:hypothetical protein GCM10008013_40010 [Paenibacillus segetis]|uniref:Uncharacterized protein n=1 Tax=Paenibacillus segetis TaxID=1325360 RepID=A0ABQ1YQ03_9BACL|nr:hypothetical protein GCM10008013_40010 [Paenibacillus segetis]
MLVLDREVKVLHIPQQVIIPIAEMLGYTEIYYTIDFSTLIFCAKPKFVFLKALA